MKRRFVGENFILLGNENLRAIEAQVFPLHYNLALKLGQSGKLPVALVLEPYAAGGGILYYDARALLPGSLRSLLAYSNIRDVPSASGRVVGRLSDQPTVAFFAPESQKSSGQDAYRWLRVEFENLSGFCALTGNVAIKEIERQPPEPRLLLEDVVIIDVPVPHFTNTETIKQARGALAYLRALVFSMESAVEDAVVVGK